MNNQVNVMIAGADMGGLIASSALHYDFQNRLLQEDRFRISRLEKDTLTMEDVEQCDLSGVEYVVNATLHDTEASFVFDEKCKKQGIPVIHAVNLGKAAFLAVEKPKGYPFSEVKKRNSDEGSIGKHEEDSIEKNEDRIALDSWNADIFQRKLGKYISQYGMFWQKPVPWIDEAIKNYSEKSFPQLSIGAYIVAGYCVNILCRLAEGKEVKYFPKFYLSPLLEEV